MIAEGRVALNGQVLTSPAMNVGPGDILTLDGDVLADREPARLWRYHKPPGLITTHKDPKGRATVFERLPRDMPRVISVGRLDLNSEGLLLLTNDGGLARQLELPSTALVRRYRARAFGRTNQSRLDRLKDGVTVEGVVYGPVEATLERGQGANHWIGLALAEGKNREVRKVLETIGLKVNRLIRVAYGPLELGDLAPGAVEEVPPRQLRQLLETGFAEPPPLQEPGPKRPQSPQRAQAPRKRPAPKRSAAASGARTSRKPVEAAKPKTAYKTGWARPKSRAKPAATGPKAKPMKGPSGSRRPER